MHLVVNVVFSRSCACGCAEATFIGSPRAAESREATENQPSRVRPEPGVPDVPPYPLQYCF